MFSHLDKAGNANMVDVTEKSVTERIAIAHGRVSMQPATFAKVMGEENPKGDIFSIARIAGIQAAKKCSDLIPLCHPLMLTSVKVAFTPDEASHSIVINCRCKLSGKTGVEMEALTGASVAALTLYDMCKAIDKDILISDIKLMSKTGGKSGDWTREGEQ